ncbi:MAG: hypothetical protein IPJ33_00595 [Gammaproteobacteria bacterium]|jgi:hypothetical protein|nr:hypothetical protein [Gammaproteobacteria bacterium]MBP6053611.1 hypothetical protein [Pseudomonadales bacterium]MBK6581410.1 hypothetical protein [Gammaproteobacteria bacterium]MBK7167778.1 hypothetical protein [Gammaproteobacteria bacterium]MBK7518640.1 hypothetical protein [Gammaproteobacteria bacterium]
MIVRNRRAQSLRARILRVLSVLAILVLALVVSYRLGVSAGGNQERIATMECEDAQALLAKHRDELNSLHQQVITLRKGAEIDGAAASEVRSQAAIAQAKIVRLEQEVALFKSITDASIRTKGVALHSFELFAGADDRSFRYRAVFLQRAQKHSTIKGHLTLEVSGTDSGGARTLALKALAPNPEPGPTGRLSLDFVYFQMVEGDITLPSGFLPSLVRIRAEVSGARSQRIDRSFEWHLSEA